MLSAQAGAWTATPKSPHNADRRQLHPAPSPSLRHQKKSGLPTQIARLCAASCRRQREASPCRTADLVRASSLMADHEARPRSRAAAVDRRAPIPAPIPDHRPGSGLVVMRHSAGTGLPLLLGGADQHLIDCHGPRPGNDVGDVRDVFGCYPLPELGSYAVGHLGRLWPASSVAVAPGSGCGPPAGANSASSRLPACGPVAREPGPARPTWISRVHPAQVSRRE